MKCLSIFFLFIAPVCRCQELSLIKLTKEEENKSAKYHYQWESTDGHVAIIDLFLFGDQTYKYSISSNVYNAFSSGHWKIFKDTMTLTSNLQKDNLPIKVLYRQRDSNDFNVRKIAFLKDLNGTLVNYAFIYINNDSTSCDYGDLLCIGNYNSIDSIRVRLENHGIYSPWVRIKPFNDLIQVIIQTTQNLRNYIVFDEEKYLIQKNKLRPQRN
jgi:hypothetical protein